MVLCLSVGCCYGMQSSSVLNQDLTSSGTSLQSISSSDQKTIDLDKICDEAFDRLQNNTSSTPNFPQNLDVGGILQKEGICWFRFERFLQPFQVVVDGASLILSTTAAILAESKPGISKDLIITTAITSAASGLLGVFLTKMANRVSTIDQQLGQSKQSSNNGLLDQQDTVTADELANI